MITLTITVRIHSICQRSQDWQEVTRLRDILPNIVLLAELAPLRNFQLKETCIRDLNLDQEVSSMYFFRTASGDNALPLRLLCFDAFHCVTSHG